ncbi:MAG: DUF3131 domain-containing protein [Gemmatimonadaceae bacterium]
MNSFLCGARFALAGLLVGVPSTAARCQPGTAQSSGGDVTSPAAKVVFDPPTVSAGEQNRVLLRSAKTAWNYVKRNSSGATGLANAVDNWKFATIWDVGSMLGALHSARGLEIISDADYRRRMDRLLQTLETMPIYNGAAFNKKYIAATAQMADKNDKPSTEGFGWSVVDLGRFLAWMKIIEQNDPVAAPAVQRVIARLDLKQLVDSAGYLLGANTDLQFNKHYDYQEGRIGYEQYAAEGLALWGVRAERAIDFSANGTPVSVLGFRVLADRRGDDVLTSEPFIMMGMELGWTNPIWEEQARNVLAAQRERFKRTRIITMVSEDAIPVKPAYFYYYLVHRNGQDFVVRAPGSQPNPSYPRWISTKAAFAWHALFPSDYTWSAVRAVQPAGATGAGWTGGVYERSKRPTPSFNVNTAGIVLEAAYYAQRGCAFIKPTCP